MGAAFNVPTRIFDEPFIWTAADGMLRLLTPFSDPYGRALGINDAGAAVGFLSGFDTVNACASVFGAAYFSGVEGTNYPVDDYQFILDALKERVEKLYGH